MPSRKRQGNDPKRRVIYLGTVSEETRYYLKKARYTGSALHKRRPADYGFIPPVNPRPEKSLCDGLRTIGKIEATRLFRSGIRLEMVSSCLNSGLPKYVWAVDNDGEAYEAKLGGDGSSYHGYRLYRDDPVQKYIVAEWRRRGQQLCPA
jgi:hypothetical protein